jgi:hypothetical protein
MSDYDKTFIEFVGEVTVGDTIQFPGDYDSYTVVAITNDGIVVRKLNLSLIKSEVDKLNEQ